MHRNLTAAIVLTAITTLTACGGGAGSPGGIPCPGLAVRKGISLDIDPMYAPQVGSATLMSCWGGVCTDSPMDLMPASKPSALPCTGTGPDAACGAAAVPTGGKSGFADLPSLAATPGEITLKLLDAGGAELRTQSLMVTPEIKYPTGPECGGGTPQAGLQVAPDGTLSERR
ncbi:hypothetical protein JOF56_011241 [Kibdelosporangium banguiense]|uniref:Secreted protein n=1 Tax=Kibdelosporangium banguiense TaxID=1365924 RepID=A0ABS4U2L0_9PSEU|nr:hypothetical protein [Kibdelosporangium banguiense]MBP2330856.1 hypothetical protein [Kibdelosporangium banguiense]